MKQLQGKKFFLLSYAAYAAIYIARLNLTIASPVLQKEQILSSGQIGMMGGMFFLLYASGQLLNGYLGDILPPKKMILTGLILTAAGNIGIGFMPSPDIMILLWGINGFAQSMLWGPLLRSLSLRFSPEKRAETAAKLVSSVGVGSVLGIVAAAGAVYFLDVRFAFLIPGIISGLAAGAVFFHFHVPLEEKRGKQKADIGVLRSKKLWVLMLPALFHGVIKDNINLWSAAYFADAFALDLAEMSFYVFAIPVLSLLGRLVYPALFRLCGCREHKVSVLALGLIAVCLLPLCNKETSVVLAAFCLSLAAAAVSVVNTSFLTVYPTSYSDRGCVSGVVGLLDFSTYLGAGISSAVYGYLLEKSDYVVLFLSWIVLSLLAILAIGLHNFIENRVEPSAVK